MPRARGAESTVDGSSSADRARYVCPPRGAIEAASGYQNARTADPYRQYPNVHERLWVHTTEPSLAGTFSQSHSCWYPEREVSACAPTWKAPAPA